VQAITAQREQTAHRFATKLGIAVPAQQGNDSAGERYLARIEGLLAPSLASAVPSQHQQRVTHMTTFPVYTVESAPEGSKPALTQLCSRLSA
jgi:hypothetical protein